MGRPPPPIPARVHQAFLRLVNPNYSSNGHRRRERLPDNSSRGQYRSEAVEDFISKQRDRSQISPQQIPAEEGKVILFISPPLTKLARFKESV